MLLLEKTYTMSNFDKKPHGIGESSGMLVFHQNLLIKQKKLLYPKCLFEETKPLQ